MKSTYASAEARPAPAAASEPSAVDPVSDRPEGAPAGVPLYLRAALVSQPGDRFELEANRIADQVVADDRVQLELDRQVGPVKVHSDTNAAQQARDLDARAYTHDGQVYFGQDQFQPHTPEGRWLVAHELAHVAQQRSATRPEAAIQRAVIAAAHQPPPTPEAVGLPNEVQAARDEKKMTGYLAGQSLKMLDLQNELATANPQTPEERQALRDKLERMVRLNAIGLMASHRASIEAARDRLLSSERRQQVEKNPSGTSVFDDMRKAAKVVSALNDAKEKLERYRSGLHFAHSDTLFRRGKVGDVLQAIVENSSEYMTEDQRQPLRDSFAIAQRNGTANDYWLFAYGATNFLLKWREDQIFGVEQSINQVYEKYPLFVSLDPADLTNGKFSSDKDLLEAADSAYKDVLAKVDRAIGDIARGEIHAFDMPRAVEVTREWMPEPVKKALDEAIQDRQVTKFWLTMGLTLLEAALMFIPVVGPVVAIGIGAGVVGAQLDDMLTRLAVSKASTTPYGGGPVGAQLPDALEWVMLGVQAVLLAFGGLAVWRSIRGAAGAIEPPPELLEQIGEPTEVTVNRTTEHPYENPPRMTRLRGQPLELSKLDPAQKYLWVIDEDGNFLVAPENQAEAGFAPGRRDPLQRPTPGVVKHGDLTPGPGGKSRGAARAGGELSAERGPDGQPTGRWIMDNNSSYTFRRVGGETLPPESLDASRDLLGLYGTDTTKIVTRDMVAR